MTSKSDPDLVALRQAALLAAAKATSRAIRAHCDTTERDLSSHHPDRWALLAAAPRRSREFGP